MKGFFLFYHFTENLNSDIIEGNMCFRGAVRQETIRFAMGKIRR